jgi:hypothetical protein
MTVGQLDQLHRLARRIDVTRLAVLGLGTDDAHQAVEEALSDINRELLEVAR